MAKKKKNDVSLAQTLADLRGKPAGDKKHKPVVKSDRGPMDEIRLADALIDLRGKPDIASKQEPQIQAGALKPTLSKGGE